MSKSDALMIVVILLFIFLFDGDPDVMDSLRSYVMAQLKGA